MRNKKIMKVTLPDKREIEISENKTYHELLAEYNPGLLKHTIAIKDGNNIYDLSRIITEAKTISPITFDSKKGKEVFWHSTAHLLAQAVKRLYPESQLTFGPVADHGPGFFYYDIFLPGKTFSDNDLLDIEKEMNNIREEALPISRHVINRAEAIEQFKKMGEHFKAQIISEIPETNEITIYKQGDFQDLCRGPHVYNTAQLGNFKLTALSGAYWKGDASNPMLQRIYGVSFPTEKELKAYLFKIEEAKNRDHRKLGKELDLFSFHEEAPGMPFYHPKGTQLFNILQSYIRKECEKRGYDELKTPTVLSEVLWQKSGHYDNFSHNMYFTNVEEKSYAIKPMNCPGSTLVYKESMKSYRDLPLRLAELGLVHRHELSGVLHGLFRVRAFTQDDAHIFCTVDQLASEIEGAIQFTIDVYKKFGFEKYKLFIATRPQKSMGSDEIWNRATQALTQSLEKLGLDYALKEGEGAFYGPKIEFNIEDCLERNWQLGTIQVDFSMPERFELEYTGSDGNKHRPVMIHRAILGSLERFMGILLEHYAGKLPFWLSPVQISILTLGEVVANYAEEIKNLLKNADIRIAIDNKNEKIGYKIREWSQSKVNYAVVIGEKEKTNRTISLRKRSSKDTIEIPITDLVSYLINDQEELA